MSLEETIKFTDNYFSQNNDNWINCKFNKASICVFDFSPWSYIFFDRYYYKLLSENISLNNQQIKLIIDNIETDYELTNYLKPKSKLERINKLEKTILSFIKIYNSYMNDETLIYLLLTLNIKTIAYYLLSNYYKRIKHALKKYVIIVPFITEYGISQEADKNFYNKYCQDKAYEILHINLSFKLNISFWHSITDMLKISDYKDIFSYNKYLFKLLSIKTINSQTMMSFIQKEIAKENFKSAIALVNLLNLNWNFKIDFVNTLPLSKWYKFLKADNNWQIFIDKFNSNSYSEMFISKFYTDVITPLAAKIHPNINNVNSIYDFEIILILKRLSFQKKTFNRKNSIYNKCFLIFLKQYQEKFQIILDEEDIKYVDLVFRRLVVANNVYTLFQFKNILSLIHFYKSNDYYQNIDLPKDYIKNYNVKKYRKVKKLILTELNFYTDSLDELALTATRFLDYENIVKILDSNLQFQNSKQYSNNNNNELNKKRQIFLDIYPQFKPLVEIITNLDRKDEIYLKKVNMVIKEIKNKNDINLRYSINDYFYVFNNLYTRGLKITLTKLNKAVEDIQEFLLPYNEHIKINLEQFNYSTKGSPFLDKINGIKLYDKYRKRLYSSIPDYQNKYKTIEFGFVNMHDTAIISNGVCDGKYLYQNGKTYSSCLTPNGAAKNSLFHGAINSNGRFFEIKFGNKIMAYSWVWRAGDVVCFDNIEVTDEILKIEAWEEILFNSYLMTANDIIRITKAEINGGIKMVVIGRPKKDIRNKYIDNLKDSPEIFKPTGSEDLYLDSQKKQLWLAGKYDNISTKDVTAIYLYKRKEVVQFKTIDFDTLRLKANGIYYEYCMQNNIAYHKLNCNYIDGYLGEDWFFGRYENGNYDFYYVLNDDRLFDEAKTYIISEKNLNQSKLHLTFKKLTN